MNYRTVQSAQAGAVHAILLENGRWMAAQGIVQWPLDWLASIESDIVRSVAAGNFRCVEIDGEIAAVAELHRQSEALWGHNAAPAEYVHKLAIRRKFSAQHLGASMLERIINDARSDGLQFVRLDCVASNARLRRYYEALGFEFVQERRDGSTDFALYQTRLQAPSDL